MEAKYVWELFEKTGNIGVYILYKRISEEQNSLASGDEKKSYADSCRGNGNKGSEIGRKR